MSGKLQEEFFREVFANSEYGYDYSENSIQNHLNDTLIYLRDKLNGKSESQAAYRRYDFDAWCLRKEGEPKYLLADTIFSFWMPFKMCLQCLPNNKYKRKGISEAPYKGSDSVEYLKNNIKDLEMIRDDIGKILPCDNELVEVLYRFADLNYTRANVMKLPHYVIAKNGGSLMNNNRGCCYYDQMPPTLYNCFNGRKLSEYFEMDDNKVEEWVKEQSLTIFFSDGEIKAGKIKPIISRFSAADAVWLKEESELIEMLEQYCELLEERARVL
ncbi:MAG: hypothetical protein LBC58_02160 [Clostridiales Family XIII bacterium]|jgi:hypothetical protein|nr:hypothetical protein [Clostridiales Family XIII bacterium]